MWNLALGSQAKAHAIKATPLPAIHAPAIYMLLPNSYTYMSLPSVFQGFKTAVCPASNPPNASAGLQDNNSYSYMPLPSVFQEVQHFRLTGLKPSKRFRRPPRQQLLQLHAPAICFSGSSRLPFDRPKTLQTLPQASKATTLTATCPCHLFFRSSSLPFASPQNPHMLHYSSHAVCQLRNHHKRTMPGWQTAWELQGSIWGVLRAGKRQA